MLFCNIDHLDERLLPATRKAGFKFFSGAASLELMFAHMEFGVPSLAAQEPTEGAYVRQQASIAAWHSTDANLKLIEAASLYRDIALELQRNSSNINAEILSKKDLFGDAARQVMVSPNSDFVKGMTDALKDKKLEGILRDLANEISNIAERIRILGTGFLNTQKLEDRDYEEAHRILNDWHPLVKRGQFVSVICYLAATVAAG